jgi:flagellar hook-associated protein 2
MDFSNVTHISFSNSGIDTDTIVQKLMQADQVPLDQLKQKQQKDLWQSDAYRQWNTDIFSLNNDTVFNMKMSGSYDTFNVNSSVPNAVTGTGTSNAIPGTYNLVVNQLATSSSFVGTNQNLDVTKTLVSQGVTSGTALTISANSDPTNPNTVQTSTIQIKDTDKIGDLVSSINSAKDSSGKSLGITAYYDSNLHQFMVKTNATGSATKITLTAFNSTDSADTTAGGNLLSSTLGIAGSSSGTVSSTGTNADITFTDLNTGTKTNVTTLSSNTVNLMGVSYTLNTPTDSNGTTITVSRNIDAEVKNIEDFVSKYNDMLSKLNTALAEPIYKDYSPLTDDQRSQMSDTQITQWETKAKSGLMNNDSILSGLVSKMRNAMTTFVNNGSTYNSLASIGITSHSYTDQGKLYVDEDKLRAALQSDPNGVKKLFSQMGDGVGDQTGKQGIVQSLSACLNGAYTQLVSKAGSPSGSQYDQSFIGKDLTSLQTRISDMTTLLQQKEQRYYNQYDAMQTAVQKFQSQGNTLAQSLGLSTTSSNG